MARLWGATICFSGCRDESRHRGLCSDRVTCPYDDSASKWLRQRGSPGSYEKKHTYSTYYMEWEAGDRQQSVSTTDESEISTEGLSLSNLTHKNQSKNMSLVIIKARHGVLDILKASWRGQTVAELAWLAGVPERKDNMLELKDSSSWVSKQRGNEVFQ